MINLILGDAISEMQKLDKESIDCILTDPPYNTGMKAVSGKAWLCHFFDDDYTDAQYLELVSKSCKEFYRLLKNDRACYIFMNYKKLGLWLEQLGGGRAKYKECYCLE